ncbi:DMT family transporter [Lacticaseibacillus pabuli]|uniref:DMT family transporter n=1 Tax=Lacticaseibacillus pabuli TaxID=3025672 RepID=A0ABY7WVX1_9LACO|nr:DMT family transporter [Lacticaseibacillus sp. KACC 23028]WDF83122.1 DMT family transporter [Lacticaseibacillus sp. KACC 23028]
MNAHERHLLGILLAAGGSLMWGVSGPASEYLFDRGVGVTWLIASKMLIAGIVLGLYCLIKDPHAFFAPWHSLKAIVHLLLFVIFGMVAMQYVYFKAVAVANAATATVLQYLSPVIILIWVAVASRTMPRRGDIVTIVMAMVGTVLVVTKGQITTLAITPNALFWGLATAVAAASYTLVPQWLLANYSGVAISAWSMIIGGLGMNLYQPSWEHIPHMDWPMIWCYLFVVVFGTVFAYVFYLLSLNYIAPTAAGLLDAFEPLGAVVTGVVFLHLHLSFWELVGGAIILATVALMTLLEPTMPEPDATVGDHGRK